MIRVHLLLLFLALFVAAVGPRVVGEHAPPPVTDVTATVMLGDVVRAPASQLIAAAVEAQVELRATGRCAVVVREVDRRCPDGAIMLVKESTSMLRSTCEPAGCARLESDMLGDSDEVSDSFSLRTHGLPRKCCVVGGAAIGGCRVVFE